MTRPAPTPAAISATRFGRRSALDAGATSAINGATSADSASDGASGMPENAREATSASSTGDVQAATANTLGRRDAGPGLTR